MTTITTMHNALFKDSNSPVIATYENTPNINAVSPNVSRRQGQAIPVFQHRYPLSCGLDEYMTMLPVYSL